MLYITPKLIAYTFQS